MASQRGQGSGKHGTHKSTRSTFLSWEVSSNSLASLVTELPEDQSSDYKADRGQTAEMSGERRNHPLRERSQAEGCPLAAISDPALGGFASTRHHRPPANGRPLSHSLSSGQRSGQPHQHRPTSPCPASTHQQCGATPFPPEGRGGWRAVGNMPPAAPRVRDAASHPWAPGDCKLGVGPRVCTVPRCDLLNNV